MMPILIDALSDVLMMSSCEPSQVHYENPKPMDRWVFDYTGNEIAWWTAGTLLRRSLSNKSVDLVDG